MVLWTVGVFAGVASTGPASAFDYIEPTFDQVVASAARIARVQIVDSVPVDHRHCHPYGVCPSVVYTMSVVEALKGPATHFSMLAFEADNLQKTDGEFLVFAWENGAAESLLEGGSDWPRLSGSSMLRSVLPIEKGHWADPNREAVVSNGEKKTVLIGMPALEEISALSHPLSYRATFDWDLVKDEITQRLKRMK